MDRGQYAQPDDELRVRMMVAAQYDAPAFVRRARSVEASYEDLLARGRRQRSEWLLGVRIHLGALRAGVGSWIELRPLLANDDQINVLERLHAEAGDPEVPMTGPTDTRGQRRALGRLRGSVERFNRRWHSFVERLDLNVINRLRDGYNRYYLLERECAVGSVRLQAPFRKLPPLTITDVLNKLPTLPVPRLAE